MATMMQASARAGGMSKDEKFVIFASSLGTIFEWYDFYLYAVLAPFFAALFFRLETILRRCCRPSPPTRRASSFVRSAR